VSDEPAVRVALTVDAEIPGHAAPPGATARILDILDAAGVHATFFLQGRWAEAEPALARRIAEAGHLVGSHGHSHARLTRLTDAAISDEVLRAAAAIRDAAGVDPRPWFRCAFGAGAASPRVRGALAALGYRHVHWTLDSRDWAGTQARALERRVVRLATGAGDGTVVLLHDWPPATPAALPGVIAGLRAVGASLVRLDALPQDRLPTGAAWAPPR
jgi:peptidoglycan-N-acetylglucosamine deacetylase